MLSILLVLVTPPKTQHWPYLTVTPPLLWYCFRIALLPLQTVGEIPPSQVFFQLPISTPWSSLELTWNIDNIMSSASHHHDSLFIIFRLCQTFLHNSRAWKNLDVGKKTIKTHHGRYHSDYINRISPSWARAATLLQHKETRSQDSFIKLRITDHKLERLKQAHTEN